MKKITTLFFMFSVCFGFSNSLNFKSLESLAPVTYEAENGKLYKGAVLQDCGSCSELKQVGDLGGPTTESGYFVSTVNVEKSGIYKMNLSFSSGETRSIFISANGLSAQEVSVNSGDWGVVGTKEIEINLFAGTNSIKFFNHVSYGPNIDKFTLDLFQEASACVNCFGPYEAESGVIFAPATIQDCDTCSNGKQVGDMGYSDRYFTQDINITTPGTYRVYVSYSSGSTRSLSITANESTTVTDNFNSVDWGVVFVKTLDITLSSGINTLKFHTPGDWSPNIDKFRLEFVGTLGTNDAISNSFNIYPNPSKDIWYINNGSSSIESINLFDVTGKEVLNLTPNKNEVEIDASNLKSGIYISKIKTPNGVDSVKLIKS